MLCSNAVRRNMLLTQKQLFLRCHINASTRAYSDMQSGPRYVISDKFSAPLQPTGLIRSAGFYNLVTSTIHTLQIQCSKDCNS